MFLANKLSNFTYEVIDTLDYSRDIFYTAELYLFKEFGIEIINLPDYNNDIRFNIGNYDTVLGLTLKMNNGHYATCINYDDRDHIDLIFDNKVKRIGCKRYRFLNGQVGFVNLRDRKLNCLGERRLMKCGQYATCIEYINNRDITVKFDSGFIREHIAKVNFIRGDIVDKKSKSRFDMTGTTIEMNCGQKATCIEDRGYNDITIRFEDGAEQKCSRGSFRIGSVKNSNLGRGEACHITRGCSDLLGTEKVMNCGFKCKVIKCDRVYDISVQFDDGTVVEHTTKYLFQRGQILHPKLGRLYKEGDSIAQRLIFLYIKYFFEDAVYDLRPCWLKNITGRNFELDIYIPSKKVAIEFDGSVPGHFVIDDNKLRKVQLIENSDNIETLYTICEKDNRINPVKHSKNKIFRLNYHNGQNRLNNLVEIVNLILNDLGINDKLFFDSEFIRFAYELQKGDLEKC